MLHLPLISRELLVAARSRKGWWLRFSIHALMVLVAAVWLAFLGVTRWSAIGGAGLFGFLSLATWLAALFLGSVTTSDAVSRERREGTLGLLFLSRVGPLEVVGAKLAGAAVQFLPLLLGVVPILGICLLLGGVTPGMLLRVSIAHGLTALGSLSVGLAASCWLRTRRATFSASLLLMLVWNLVPPIADVLQLPGQSAPWRLHPAWLGASPFRLLQLADDNAYRANPDAFRSGVGLILAVIVVFVAVAACGARRLVRDAVNASVPRPRNRRGGRGRIPAADGTHPLSILFPLGRVARILLMFPPVCMAALLLLLPWADAGWNQVPMVLSVFLNMVPLSVLAWHRTDAIQTLHQTGMLELLQGTPAFSSPDHREIPLLLRGLGRTAAMPVVFSLVATSFLLLIHGILASRFAGVGDRFNAGPIGMVLFQAVGLVLRYHAVSAFSAWRGLRSPNSAQAFLSVIGVTVLLPAVLPCLLDWAVLLGVIAWSWNRLQRPGLLSELPAPTP